MTRIFLFVCTWSSHLIAIQPGGPMLSDALSTSPILRAEDGTSLAPAGSGFEYGIDPSEDPELAMVRDCLCPSGGNKRFSVY